MVPRMLLGFVTPLHLRFKIEFVEVTYVGEGTIFCKSTSARTLNKFHCVIMLRFHTYYKPYLRRSQAALKNICNPERQIVKCPILEVYYSDWLLQ